MGKTFSEVLCQDNKMKRTVHCTNIYDTFTTIFADVSASVPALNKLTEQFDHITNESDSNIESRVFAQHESYNKSLLDAKGIAGFIDHTVLKADATKEDVNTLCQQAITHKFACVCVNGSRVQQATKVIGKQGTVGAAIGFPLGAATTHSKVAETSELCSLGCSEIDMVINVGYLKDKNYNYVYNDILQVVEEAAKHTAIVKVILECCLLSSEEIIAACILSVAAKAHFVKTSTGFSTHGAKVEHVWLMKVIVGKHALVKASGGIRDKATLLAMLENGASRIGTSSGVSLL